MREFCGLLLASLLVVLVHADRGYIVTAPGQMIVGTTDKVCITLLEVDDDVRIRIRLSEDSDEENEYITDEEYLMTSSDQCVDVSIPDDIDTGRKFLVVDGQSVDGNSDFSFDVRKRITLISTQPKTFIQTDKPIYKPGQTVKFRVLSIKGTGFRPYKQMLSLVYIENPSGVRMIQWQNVTTTEGLVELEMPLSEEPVMGQWKITTDLEETITSKHFDVDEYVLPKFEVIVTPPPFIIVTDEVIDIGICGRYTYGQPVRGTVSTKVCIPGFSYYQRAERPCVEREELETGTDGCVEISIPASELHIMSSNYSIWGAKLNVHAQFTEKDTDITLNGTHDTTKIFRIPYELEILAPSSFKPGVPYYGKVKVKYPDGSPADGKLVNLKITTNNGDIMDRNFTSVGGVIELSVPDLAIDTSRMQITARGPGFTKPYSWFRRNYFYRVYDPRTSMTVRPWYSPSGHFLQIEPIRETLQMDSEYEFNIFYTTTETEAIQLYYKVISHGDIIHADSSDYVLRSQSEHPLITKPPPVPTEAPQTREEILETRTESDEDTEELLKIDIVGPDYYPWWVPVDPTVEIANPGDYGIIKLKLLITNNMSPKSKLLLYYVRNDGEVIADSAQFKVEKVFTNDVRLEFAEEEELPGAQTQLHLSAAPGSLCALGVVDKSVHLMRSSNQLTKQQIFDTLNGYDLPTYYGYEERSTHCDGKDGDDFGRPYYYGRRGYSTFDDSSKAFENVGMVVMTNVLLETRPCQQRNYWRPYYYDNDMMEMPMGKIFNYHIIYQPLQYYANLNYKKQALGQLKPGISQEFERASPKIFNFIKNV